MPLNYPGPEAPAVDGGLSIRAQDASTGEYVRVHVSDEAIQDHGLSRCKIVGSDKYDAGRREPDGHVFVRTADC